jgi:hypothetical protein
MLVGWVVSARPNLNPFFVVEARLGIRRAELSFRVKSYLLPFS